MAHIELPAHLPGISGPMAAYPETGDRLRSLAQELLRGESTLSPAERETIATHVSQGNHCSFCTLSHAAAARELWGEHHEVVDNVLKNGETSAPDAKLCALLMIADKVRRDGRLVEESDIQKAREAGADDKAIHDTVLIAAAFCMFNRYVDGLATQRSENAHDYRAMGVVLAQEGYERKA